MIDMNCYEQFTEVNEKVNNRIGFNFLSTAHNELIYFYYSSENKLNFQEINQNIITIVNNFNRVKFDEPKINRDSYYLVFRYL
jgi:hypothetical protein